MSQTTFADGRGISHAGSGGRSLVFPDICTTQVGPATVPLPYPNLGLASDAIDGGRSVRCDGRMPMLKDARYRRSSGDEAGSLGGLVSRVHMGDCRFACWSFSVRCEGRGVCRLGDPLLHNHGNTVG